MHCCCSPNVHDNVAFGLRCLDVERAEARRRVANALELVPADALRVLADGSAAGV
jgi:energy-coupling factor transporter ATP-binding protein EcfA2